MSIENELATSQGRRDQGPNKTLAQKIVTGRDTAALDELVTILKNPKNKDVLFDALKVIETVGELNPDMARPAFDVILRHLKDPANKIVWMAMSALSHLTPFYPQKTFDKLELIVGIMDGDSIIAKDKGFKILTDLYKQSQFRSVLVPLMEEQLLMAPANQLGQYTEKWMEVAQKPHFRNIQRALETRSRELQNPSHQKRIAKNLKKLNKLISG